MAATWFEQMHVQTQLSHLNLDARSITDACLRLMLPLASRLKELDMYGARVAARGAALLAAAYTGLQRLDLCGGHITGVKLTRTYAQPCKTVSRDLWAALWRRRLGYWAACGACVTDNERQWLWGWSFGVCCAHQTEVCADMYQQGACSVGSVWCAYLLAVPGFERGGHMYITGVRM
jgi:hypothetical protein